MSTNSTHVNFVHEMFDIGTLQGFKYFNPKLKSKEELVLTIFKSSNTNVLFSNNANSLLFSSGSSTNTLNELGNNSSKKLLSLDKDLEPTSATPSFLIAFYGKYKCPYVWYLKSENEEASEMALNLPIKLETTSKWKSTSNNSNTDKEMIISTISVYDVITELVLLVVNNAMINPFEINFNELSNLAKNNKNEAIILIMSLIDTLQLIYSRKYIFKEKVLNDLRKLYDIQTDVYTEIIKNK